MSLDGGTVVIDVQARFRNGMSPEIDNADKKVDKFEESMLTAKKEMDRLSSTKANLDVNDKGTGKIDKFLQKTKSFSAI